MANDIMTGQSMLLLSAFIVGLVIGCLIGLFFRFKDTSNNTEDDDDE